MKKQIADYTIEVTLNKELSRHLVQVTNTEEVVVAKFFIESLDELLHYENAILSQREPLLREVLSNRGYR